MPKYRGSAAVAASAMLSSLVFSACDLGTSGTEVAGNWGDYEPAWSPDGSEIAVSSTRPKGGLDFDIYLMDMQGQTVSLTDGLFAGSPSWSPDGLSVAFSTGSQRIYIVSRDGSELSQIPTDVTVLGNVAWSPSGEAIAFTSGGVNLADEIYVLDVVTSKTKRLTAPGPSSDHLSWSPDGTQAVYRRFADPDGEDGIYRMQADGSNVVQLLIDSDPLLDPAWSPCGTQIAFAADDQGKFAIHLMDSDGSNVSVLTDGLGDDRSPTWSPDCSQIAFSSNRDGDVSSIWIIGVDGSGLRKLTVRE